MLNKRLLRLIMFMINCTFLIFPLSTCKMQFNSGINEQEINFMRTSGNKILDENGNEFIIKAINVGSGGFEPDAWNWGNPVQYLDPYRKMTEDDYEEIAGMGFNAVRLCMDYKHFYFDAWTWDNPLPTETTYVSYDPGVDAVNAWKYFDDNIQWAKKYGLKVIPNLHYPPGGYQSLGEGTGFWEGDYINGVYHEAAYFQDLFIYFWVELASRYADEPAILGYGLLNEPVPTVRISEEMTWNDIIVEVAKAVARYDEIMVSTVDSIRAVDPNHIIVIEKILMVKDLVTNKVYYPGDSGVLGHLFTVLPYKNILYEFHYYLSFNLQYVSQEPALIYTSSEHWPYYKSIIDSRLAWSDTHNLPVFLGEYGTTRYTSAMDLTLYSGLPHESLNLGGENFLNDVLGYIIEKGLNSAYYSWKESNPDGFGLYEQYHWTWKGINAHTRAIPNTSFIDIIRLYF